MEDQALKEAKLLTLREDERRALLKVRTWTTAVLVTRWLPSHSLHLWSYEKMMEARMRWSGIRTMHIAFESSKTDSSPYSIFTKQTSPKRSTN